MAKAKKIPLKKEEIAMKKELEKAKRNVDANIKKMWILTYSEEEKKDISIKLYKTTLRDVFYQEKLIEFKKYKIWKEFDWLFLEAIIIFVYENYRDPIISQKITDLRKTLLSN